MQCVVSNDRSSWSQSRLKGCVPCIYTKDQRPMFEHLPLPKRSNIYDTFGEKEMCLSL